MTNSTPIQADDLCYDPFKIDRLIRSYRSSKSARRRQELENELLSETLHNQNVIVDGTKLADLSDSELVQEYDESLNQERLYMNDRINREISERGMDAFLFSRISAERRQQLINSEDLSKLRTHE